MQNFLTKQNIIIAVVVFLGAVALIVFLGSGSSNNSGGGLFGGLFPSVGDNPVDVSTPFGTTTVPGGLTGLEQENLGEILMSLPLTPSQASAVKKGDLLLHSSLEISSFHIIDEIVRYHKNTPENLGHVFERGINGEGDETRISNLTIPQIIKVVWAPNGEKAVAFYNVEGAVRKLLIDYSSKGDVPDTEFLPNSVTDVVFSPNSRSMAFINNLGTSQNIFIASAGFTSQRKLINNNVPIFEISWPDDNFIALKTKSSYALPSYLYTVNTNSGSMIKVAEGRGLDAVWASDGDGVLYSASDGNGNMLNLKYYDLNKKSTKEISVKTIAEKCAFSENNEKAYCGVPKVIAPAKYPDDYWQGTISSEDNILEINVASGSFETVLSSFSEVTQPKVSPDDSYMFFIDKRTNALWGLKL